MWSGYRFEDILKREDHKIFEFIDIMVDGQFEEDKKNIKLKYCGSENQRVIDVQESLKQNELILYKER